MNPVLKRYVESVCTAHVGAIDPSWITLLLTILQEVITKCAAPKEAIKSVHDDVNSPFRPFLTIGIRRCCKDMGHIPKFGEVRRLTDTMVKELAHYDEEEISEALTDPYLGL